jgi:putative ABC transport system substrate-binding protein
MISRRTFALGIGCAALARPLVGKAQPAGKTPVIGVLTSNPGVGVITAFLDALREVGYEDGRNVILVIRSADANLDRLPDLAAGLVEMKVDVIVSINTPPTREAIKATKDIPIVMSVGDALGTGFVSNLAHPGGNVTGVTALGPELTVKRLQLLKEMAPAAKRVAALFNPDDPITAPQIPAVERSAPQIGVEVQFFPVRSQDSLIAAFTALTDWHADGVLWLAGQEPPFIQPTIEFAAERRLPTMMGGRAAVRSGGLVSYAPDPREINRRLAMLVEKILKGAKPADLPVEQPTKYGVVVNLKTAKALGLTIPQSILARADEVIE